MNKINANDKAFNGNWFSVGVAIAGIIVFVFIVLVAIFGQ